jgi:hypothetical protein
MLKVLVTTAVLALGGIPAYAQDAADCPPGTETKDPSGNVVKCEADDSTDDTTLAPEGASDANAMPEGENKANQGDTGNNGGGNN